MIKVSSLHIYPIKGMQGVSVSSAKVLERGFAHDRRYMLIDEAGVFISQRTHSQLVFFYPQIVDNHLKVTHNDKNIKISLEASLDNTIDTRIFENAVRATEVSQDANDWFSVILGQKVRLVKMSQDDVRLKRLIKGPDQVELSFADGYPYLIAGTESLNLLNTRLENSLSLNRFRANIVLETTTAHIEDTWNEIIIGDVGFLVIKPCARCPVVTVDQYDGTKTKEPLKALAQYRKKDNNVYFGANAICREKGEVYVGDSVIVL